MKLFKKIAFGIALALGFQASAGVINLDSLLNGKRDEATVRKVLLECVQKYGKVVLYSGADWCKFCRSTKAAILALMSQFPDVMFIIVDTDLYRFLKNGTIPKVRFHKNGVLLQETGSLDKPRLKALLNQYYR